VVGARQLDRVNARMQTLVDDVGKADNLNSALRIELLGAIRMEKNAALVGRTKPGLRSLPGWPTSMRNGWRTCSRSSKRQLDTSGDANQQADLDKFRNGWQLYRQSLNEVLKLAQANTNTRARRLLRDEVQPVADDLEAFFERTAVRLAEKPAAEGAANSAAWRHRCARPPWPRS